MPVHALTEAAGNQRTGRCGVQAAPSALDGFSAWEAEVNCPLCMALRSPAQTAAIPHQRLRTALKPYGGTNRTRAPVTEPHGAAQPVLAKLDEVFPPSR